MFRLDGWIAGYSDSASVLFVALAAAPLGLRHAMDPDHIAAMTTLIAGGRERAVRAAARLGLAWGLGHATSLIMFGVPIVVLGASLPARLEQVGETLVGLVIVLLAVRLLVRSSAARRHLHEHPAEVREMDGPAARTALGAYGIGLVHGMGGSAGVSLLILASIQSRQLALLALVLLASFTAVSMTLITAGYGIALRTGPVRHAFETAAPVLGLGSLAFGAWYAAAAWGLVTQPF